MLHFIINRWKIAHELSVLLVWGAEFAGCSLERLWERQPPVGGSRAGVTGQSWGDGPAGSSGNKVCGTWKDLRTPCCMPFGLGAVQHGFDDGPQWSWAEE